jgi:hypothetical protein
MRYVSVSTIWGELTSTKFKIRNEHTGKTSAIKEDNIEKVLD